MIFIANSYNTDKKGYTIHSYLKIIYSGNGCHQKDPAAVLSKIDWITMTGAD